MSAVLPWAHPWWWGWQLRTPRPAACWGWRPRAPPRAPPGLMVLLKRQAGLGPDPLQVKIYGGICLGEGFITAFKRPRGCWGAAAPGGDLPCTAMQGGGSSHSPS